MYNKRGTIPGYRIQGQIAKCNSQKPNTVIQCKKYNKKKTLREKERGREKERKREREKEREKEKEREREGKRKTGKRERERRD